MDEIKPHRLSRLILAAACICSVSLFLRHGGTSLNYNESHNLLYAATRSPAQLLKIDDMHPPGFYVLIHFWRNAAGSNEMLLRLPSLLFSLLSMLFLYKIGRRIFGESTALCAALLYAVSPLAFEATVSARPYALMTLVFLISLHFFLNILEDNRTAWHAGNSASIYAALLLHYYGIFLPIYQFILLMVESRQRRRQAVKWLLFQAIVAAAYFPFAYIAATHQLGMVNPAGGASILTFSNLIKLLYAMSPLSQQYHISVSLPMLVVTVLFTLLAGLGLLPIKRSLPLVCAIASPIIIVAAVSNLAGLKFFQAYHFTFLVPIFALLVANGLLRLGKIGYAGASLIVLAAMVMPVWTPNPDWKACSEYLKTNTRRDDRVIVCPDLSDALLFYWPAAQIIPLGSVGPGSEEPRRIWLVLVYENIYYNVTAKDSLLRWFRYLGFRDEPVAAGVENVNFILLSR